LAKSKSPIDELFYDIYGFYAPKAGQAYERLVAAVYKLLFDEDVRYDQMVRGEYSRTIYQLDGLTDADQNGKMIEAKDYTIDEKKVGRSDIQKMQGALTDLSVDRGLFASATNYTNPAVKYAQSSNGNPLQKPIDLYHIRPSTIEDEKGRLKKLVFNISTHLMNFPRASFNPVFTNDARVILKDKGYENKLVSFNITDVYDKDGASLITIGNLSKNNPPDTTGEIGFVSKGCWVLKGGYIHVDGQLYAIEGLEYSVPFLVTSHKVVIESEGMAKLYVKSSDGSIDKLIYDVDLRKVQFIDGKVIKL
jgi:hypothetical protein